MKIDINELSPVQWKVRIELPAETVAHEFARAYHDLSQRVRIKGFRAGKAPRNVLRGVYGDEIKGRLRSRLVEDALAEVVRERGLQIVSRPEIEASDLEDGCDFSFSAVFEVKPEIIIKEYTGTEVERIRLSVTEDQVNEALARLQESHARLEPVENRELIQRGDFVVLDYVGSIAGKPFDGGKGENYVLEVGGGQALPQFEDAVVGLKLGEHRAVQVTYPENYPNRELAGKCADFSVIAREIKQKVLPPLDDEFAKDYGECASLEELKTAIRARLEGQLKQIQDEELKDQIVNRLLDAHSFAPPPAMVERQTRYLMERNQSQMSSESSSPPDGSPTLEETRKALEVRATRQVQATLLLEKISRLEKIEVSDKEIQERIDHLVRAAGERAKTVREIYSRPEAREDLRAQMIAERTLAFLLAHATVKDVDPPSTKVDEGTKKS
jgi:trigger factor